MSGRTATFPVKRLQCTMRAYLLGFMLLLSAAVSPASAQQTGFNYSGRVKLNRVPFTGPGLFKFAIVSQDGQVTYWTNDGVTVTNAEPTTQVPIDVQDGYFSLKIGDTELPGMAMLDASLFNGNERLYLRVWFSDGEHGFQELTPPSEISNPELLGLQNLNVTNIYVDAVTGNDRNSGTKPNRAKQTLQSAWSIVPKFVQQDVKIQLAPGTYYGTTLLKGKSVTGDATINIIGNTSAPATVVLSGAKDNATSTTGFSEFILIADGQRNIVVQGVQLQRAGTVALEMENRAQVRLNHTFFLNNPTGIRCISSDLAMLNSKIGDYVPYSWGAGIYIREQARATLENCEIYNQNPGGEGLACWALGIVFLKNTLIRDCHIALHTQSCSIVDFAASGNVFRDCYIGISARWNCCISGSFPVDGALQFQNCTIERQISTGVQDG